MRDPDNIGYVTDSDGKLLYWYDKKQKELMDAYLDKRELSWFYTMVLKTDEYSEKHESRKKPQDRWKIGIVKVGQTQKTVWLDPLNAEAYKCGAHYAKTWMRISKYKFVRWATSFDV